MLLKQTRQAALGGRHLLSSFQTDEITTFLASNHTIFIPPTQMAR